MALLCSVPFGFGSVLISLLRCSAVPCAWQVEKSLHLQPSHHITWFNMAVAKLHTAICTTKQEEPTVPDVAAAQKDLGQAKATLAYRHR